MHTTNNQVSGRTKFNFRKILVPALALLISSLHTIPSSAQPHETKSYLNGPIRLYYEEFGSGEPLYILTGGPGMPPWEPGYLIVDSLKKDYTCILLHQRGSGKSRGFVMNKETINIEAYLSDIEKLVDIRNDKNITLLGISWGGLLAQSFAARHPEKVARLVLVCSAPPSYKLWEVLFDNQFARFSLPQRDSMADLQKIFSAVTPAQLESFKTTNPASKELAAFRQFIRIVHSLHFYDRSKLEKNWDSIFQQFNFEPIPLIDQEVIETKWDITAALKKINTPALIIYGRQDDQGESTFFLQKECLQNSRLHVIEKCGHTIWQDQPKEFFIVLKEFLITK